MIGEQQQIVAEGPGLWPYLEAVAIIGGVVWCFAETAGTVLKAQSVKLAKSKAVKFTIAMSAGPLFAVAAKGVGWLVTPVDNGWAWVFAVLMGAASSTLAVAGHNFGLGQTLDGIKNLLKPKPPASKLPQ